MINKNTFTLTYKYVISQYIMHIHPVSLSPKVGPLNQSLIHYQNYTGMLKVFYVVLSKVLYFFII